jgi:hypothetical protein
MRKQGVTLEDEADRTLFDGKRTHILSVDRNAAAVGLIEPGNQAEQGGFAASAPAQKDEPFSLFNGEGAIFQHRPGAKRFEDSFQSDHETPFAETLYKNLFNRAWINFSEPAYGARNQRI